ncbi:uncharacterized protein LOC144627240 [Crassostrea virginica]
MACKDKDVVEELDDLQLSESEWNEEEYQTEMEKLPLLAEGPKVFEIWQKTLLFWFSSRHNEVYLVTPFLDKNILEEFLDIVKKKEATARIGKIFIREKCDETYTVWQGKIKLKFENISKNLKNDDLFAKKVSGKIVQIKEEINYFHEKFIACVNSKTSTAEVLLTSANFNTNHLTRWENGKCNHDSVAYHLISKEKFYKNFINPLTDLL